ncbi:hypothetical protein AO366_0392 [Moraxella catarrhalis]|uniref:Uncharacterized protein n=1 Tax=Moraxella catarrhalis TaxID=480 RepID=A0A198WRY9_MORCA|nr:hypothetical protein AO377_1249 [Moraxella catarrhalis]DAR36328.1 MAG TPA: hypothetical protein [Caudoviricetes sp.]OAV13206.1 hypothetical protein AO375_1610 [Moraxella catarrhalis]OAV23592.1 hypothetical protein AO370_1636 [Moraxella catarrhalis]OAV32229.1 hypothetical protein AO368_0494 [Moraxella catarrhalis]
MAVWLCLSVIAWLWVYYRHLLPNCQALFLKKFDFFWCKS